MPTSTGNTMDVLQIMKVLPHRYPMLLIDRITFYEPRKRATGYKNLTMNEEFYQGHFPGYPLMPGVLMIEALAQLGGVIILGPDDFRRRVAFLAGIEKAKFRRTVVPGERLDMEAVFLRGRPNVGWVGVQAKVGGKVACSAELMFAVQLAAYFGLDASVLHE
jgi:3-hydroxyacyl-[acyl-carrier-protein] dehydratase